MADDDVPPDEMFSIPRGPDDLDAARRGEPIDDRALTDLVGTMRSAYLPEEPRRRSAALAAFAGPGDRPLEPLVAPTPTRAPVRRPVAAGLVAVLATLTGKVVLGGAVAAAAVGGLHAAEVVDVPLLPDVRSDAPVAPADPDPTPDARDHGGETPDVVEETPPVGTHREPAATTVPAHERTSPPDDAPDAPADPGADDRRPVQPGPSTDAPPTTATPPSTTPPTAGASPTTGPPSTDDPEADAPRTGGADGKQAAGAASPVGGHGDAAQETVPGA